MSPLYTIGIDEVGRGPLAGPVTLCAVCVSKKNYFRLRKVCRGIKDSKKLSVFEREKWFSKIKKLKKEKILSYTLASVSNKIIDTKGISFAIKKALAQTLKKLKCDPKKSRVLLDGSLYASREYKNQKTIIRGDEKEFLISLASIVAKVSRDSFMTKIGKRYPAYGFEIHKGYGTALHRKYIENKGFSAIHRRSFCRNIRTN